MRKIFSHIITLTFTFITACIIVAGIVGPLIVSASLIDAGYSLWICLLPFAIQVAYTMPLAIAADRDHNKKHRI